MTEPSKDLVVASNAYSRASLTERQQYIRMLAAAGNLLPSHLRGAGNVGDPGKAFLLAETGDMLGIHPMAAVTGVHIIDGKPSISANLMSGLVRKAGHKLRVKVTGTLETGDLVARAELIRADDPDYTFEVVWTIDKAKRAGLFPGKSGSNWQRYPEAMLKARVVSEIIREGAADVLMGGNVYTPEELGAEVDESGEPVVLNQVRDEGAPAPKPQATAAPIVDDQPQAEDQDFDWVEAIAQAKSRADMATLWQKASREGLLGMDIKVGKVKRQLGAYIKEIGEAIAQAEAAAGQPLPDEEPAVLADPQTGEVQDESVVDAEVVEDEPEPKAGEAAE